MSSSGQYAAWSYRRIITIENPPTVDGYQAKFTVPMLDGMNPDYSDIRFTTTTNEPISYWIESSTPIDAIVWLRLPLDCSELTMYYGNPNATSESDGNVFLVFGDFNSMVTLDPDRFYTISKSGGTATVENGELKLYQNPASRVHNGIYVIPRVMFTKTIGITIEFKYRKPTGYDSNIRIGQRIWAVSDSFTANREGYYSLPVSNHRLLWRNPINSYSMTSTRIDLDGQGNIRVDEGAWGTVNFSDIWMNPGSWSNLGETYNLEFGNVNYNNYPCYYDDIIVRYYLPTEPILTLGDPLPTTRRRRTNNSVVFGSDSMMVI